MTFGHIDAGARDFACGLASAFAPPLDIRPSEWAERHIVLTSDFAAEPGNYSLDRTPWCRQPMDDAADTGISTVVITGASQCGKTQLSLAVAGYYADLRPCSIMHVVPTDALSETFSPGDGRRNVLQSNRTDQGKSKKVHRTRQAFGTVVCRSVHYCRTQASQKCFIGRRKNAYAWHLLTSCPCPCANMPN